MNKWNKADTGFIVKSLFISGISLLVWYFFYPFQINEDYLEVSLNEEEAKSKALQYISSRGWDVTDHTYSIRFSQNENVNWDWQNLNYFKESLAQGNKKKTQQIGHLSGAQRWNMRWYNPPNEEEFKISFTKDGELTFFHHILPDSASGDSLPEDIALNIAKMYLKDMTDTKWEEEDWDLKDNIITQKPNRLDYYFQWENNKYNFDGSTIRMSIRVHGNEVVRFNRWLETTESLNKQFINWGSIRSFFEDTWEFLFQLSIVLSILVSIFYFKLPTQWITASKFAIVIFIIKMTERFLFIPTSVYLSSSEDSYWSFIAMRGINEFVNGMFGVFAILVLTAGFEKLYRQSFPHYISIKNLFNLQGFTSKLFFNKYAVGLVAATITLPLTAIFYYFLQQSGKFITYQYFDFIQILTGLPLLSILFSVIFDSALYVLPFAIILLLIYKICNSKGISTLITSILFSVAIPLGTDPAIFSLIFGCLIGIGGGFVFFRYGFLTLLIFTLGRNLLFEVVPIFYTSQINYIATGVILILLLLFPLIFCIIHYLKFGYTTSPDSLLNSAEDSTEILSVQPIIPKHEPLPAIMKVLAFAVLFLGFTCLLIPKNRDLNWEFTVSEDQAIETAINTIENQYGGDVSGFQVATAHWGNWMWGSNTWSMGPYHFILSKRSADLAYLLEKIGRSGIAELFEKYNLNLNGWRVNFYKPNVNEKYWIAIDSRENRPADMFHHHISDSVSSPSGDQEAAEKLIEEKLFIHGLDFSNLSIHETSNRDHDVRIDYSIDYKRELNLKDQFSIEERIATTISGNKLTRFFRYFNIPDDWERKFDSYHPLYLLCTWLPLILWISFCVAGTFFLIRNTFLEKFQISWVYLTGILIFISLSCITYFINYIPVFNGWYWPNRSWLVFWLDVRLGSFLKEIATLCAFIIVPVSCAYFANPHIKNLLSKSVRKLYSKDALISGIATMGAVLLYRPVQYILYAYFPGYLDLSSGSIEMTWFSTYLPVYNLLLTILIESLWIFSLSYFFYFKYQEYSTNGKKFKKYLILAAVCLFYLFYNNFVDLPTAMIPHFLARLWSLGLFLMLLKYFWRNNPLSHLWGVLIYFHFDRILSFISAADPTLKPQGWILLGAFILFFIYSVGLGAIKGRIQTKTS